MYVYVRTHHGYLFYNPEPGRVVKLGIATNLKDRDSSYATSEVRRGIFEKIFEIHNIERPELLRIEGMLHAQFAKFHVKDNGGSEFFLPDIIELIALILQDKGYSFTELADMTGMKHSEKFLQKKREREIIMEEELAKIATKKTFTPSKKPWSERPYQKQIIEEGYEKLVHEKKLYIELATGGGKSYIVYNIFKKLSSDIFIIFSPRKKINEQNAGEKYLRILGFAANNVYCTSSLKKYRGEKIIISCIQSYKKVAELIRTENLQNIAIWFDEAHWSVEKWVGNKTDETQFLLQSSDHIQYRIFTSASPDKDVVGLNEGVLGELYNPIKVCELIAQQWLCQINPYVFSQSEKENPNLLLFILTNFNSQGRTFGFSFHNSQKNAFMLFYQHYLKFINEETYIKPFFLVGDGFTHEFMDRIQLECSYSYEDISVFEQTPNSIGYVVQQYSMGYDFNKLDMICLSDPKLSAQDIIQCIGRGTRPDKLGLGGKNKDKVFNVLIPVFMEEDAGIESKFKKTVAVLSYLQYDIGIEFDQMHFCKSPEIKRGEGGGGSPQDYLQNDIVIQAMLLELMEKHRDTISHTTTFEQAKRIIKKHGVANLEEYFVLCNEDPRLNKHPDEIFKGKFKNWCDYLSIERKYYTLDVCSRKVIEYCAIHPEIRQAQLDLNRACQVLCDVDECFPPPGLWCDYYSIGKLADIIKISVKKVIKVKTTF
jgi:hypothetical protein